MWPTGPGTTFLLTKSPSLHAKDPKHGPRPPKGDYWEVPRFGPFRGVGGLGLLRSLWSFVVRVAQGLSNYEGGLVD